MPSLIVGAIAYLVMAALVGWWPFADGVFKTLSGQCTYEVGYDDGWDGAVQQCKAEDYLAGYDDGDFDAECHYLKCTKRDATKFKRIGCGNWCREKC